MRKITLILAVGIIAGCSSTGPGETKKFKLGPSGGYSGEPVGNCSQRAANEECRKLGWAHATDYSCGTVHVTGGFFGSFDQDVMYSVTCWREK